MDQVHARAATRWAARATAPAHASQRSAAGPRRATGRRCGTPSVPARRIGCIHPVSRRRQRPLVPHQVTELVCGTAKLVVLTPGQEVVDSGGHDLWQVLPEGRDWCPHRYPRIALQVHNGHTELGQYGSGLGESGAVSRHCWPPDACELVDQPAQCGRGVDHHYAPRRIGGHQDSVRHGDTAQCPGARGQRARSPRLPTTCAPSAAAAATMAPSTMSMSRQCPGRQPSRFNAARTDSRPERSSRATSSSGSGSDSGAVGHR